MKVLKGVLGVVLVLCVVFPVLPNPVYFKAMAFAFGLYLLDNAFGN